MRILFISKNLLAGDLTRRLKAEGHEVRLFIGSKRSRECFNGLVSKTNNWKKELSWVGKEGLIIFDDHDYGKLQDDLRKKGYAVVGGNQEADRLELNREYAQSIFKEYGLKTVLLKDFRNIASALKFAKQWRVSWVIKQNHSIDKSLTYVGKMYDGTDVVDVLTRMGDNPVSAKTLVSLHKKVDGIEIGVGRYFNGNDWVGPIEFNVEHPRLFPGNIGPTTNELGTLAWYDDNEKNRLYGETLAKLKPYLKKIAFRGDIALNCIVNKHGAFILEATPRLGSPIVHLHDALHVSPWGELFSAIAHGQSYELKWRKGYGVVVLVAAPPFPYAAERVRESSFGLRFSLGNLTKSEMRDIHFEGVACDDEDKQLYRITDPHGYLLYVTGVASSIALAQKRAYRIIEKINIPNMFYRNDIGTDFAVHQKAQLEEWGYLNKLKKTVRFNLIPTDQRLKKEKAATR